MRWNKITANPIKAGDTRVINKFLFLPIEINKQSRWLEFVAIEQECYIGTCLVPDGMSYSCIKWKNKQWVNI